MSEAVPEFAHKMEALLPKEPPRSEFGPSNVEAEAALLGALMIGNDLIDMVAEKVDPEDFFASIHGDMYGLIVRERMLGRPVNPVTIKPHFDGDERLAAIGGTAYLARLTNDGMGLLATRELAEQVAELAARRRLLAGMTELIENCHSYSKPLAEIIAEAETHLIVRHKDGIHQPTAAECVEELFAGYQDEGTGVRCGSIPPLDDLMGPAQAKELIIVAARPGMGKTAMALSYSIGAARNGHGVLFVSLEMSSRELGARMVADMCFAADGGVPYGAIQSGKMNDWQRRRAAESHSRIRGLPIQVVDAGTLTIGKLAMIVRRHARRFEARGEKLDLVVVDYLQLLSPDARGRSSYEAVSDVSRGLKAIAKDQGLAVMALAQLSRKVEERPDKRPQLSDLRDSGQIEQDADAVLFLLREEYYLRQAEPDEYSPKRIDWETRLEGVRGQIEFILAKRRSGTTGRAFGTFHGGYQAVRGVE